MSLNVSKMTMTTKLQHPFLHGLKEVPEGREKELAEIRDWLTTQPHLPKMTDEYIYLFLHSNYWRRKDTKETIECYFSLRSNTPDLFTGRDPLSPRNQTILDMTEMVALPEPTAEGYRILVYRLVDFDYGRLNFADAVRVFCMVNDARLSEDRLAPGYIVVFDMKGCTLGHLTRVTLPALRAFMHYIQNGHPARLKKIHVVHTASFINQVMCLIRPLIHSELLELLQLSTAGPAAVLEPALLPEEYGGPLPSLQTYHAQQRRNLETTYRDWLIESEVWKADEKKRVKKPSKGMFGGLSGTFKSLDID